MKLNLISKVKNWFAGKAASSNYVYMANVINGQIANTVEYVKKAYKVNADIYAITSFIASKVSTVPFILYEVKNQKQLEIYKALSAKDYNKGILKTKDKALNEASDTHRIVKMLNVAPNEKMPATEFKFGFALNRLLMGNSFVRGFAPEAEPVKFVELHLLPPQFTLPIGGSQYTAARAYRMTWNAEEIPGEQIAHSRYFNPDFEIPGNPYVVGMSPVEAAAKALQRSNSGYDLSTNAYENGGMAGVLYQDGGAELSEPQRKELQSHIDKKVTGAGNYQQILAASSKMGWLKIGESPADLGVLQTLLADLRTLCSVYHVNSALFNDPENKTYSNMSEARKAAITDAVLPELCALRDMLNLWLVPGWNKADNKNYFIDFDASVFPELQENMKEMVEWLDKAWWISPNQKLQQMDYDTQGPEYDQIFVPMGVAPLSAQSAADDEADEDFNKAFSKVKYTDYE